MPMIGNVPASGDVALPAVRAPDALVSWDGLHKSAAVNPAKITVILSKIYAVS
jgi:hypothetical protein